MGLFHAFRRSAGSLVLLALVAAVLLRPWEWESPWQPAPAGAAWAHVTRAVDGDTIEVRLGGETADVRYIGVDTPETVKPGTPVQCFGPRASAFEHRTVEGHRVRLVTGVEPRDYYGRLLAYVWVDGRPHPRFLEAELLRRGLARTLTFHPNDRFATRFEGIAQNAARRGEGLWNAC